MSGSSRVFSLNSVSFNIAADADVQVQNIPEKAEKVLYYKGSSEKSVRQTCFISGIKLVLTPDEYDALISVMADKPLKGSYTNAEGTMYKDSNVSLSEVGEYSQMEGTLTLRMDAFYQFEVVIA
jgi:hypothetical protein